MNANKLIFVLLLICTFLLTGCSKSTQPEKNDPEIALCDSIEPALNEYESNKISFNELMTHLKDNYDNNCLTNDNASCTSVNSLISAINRNANIKDEIKESYVSNIKMFCTLARDKK